MKKLVVMFGVLMIISRVAIAGEVNAPKATNTSVTMKGEIVKIFYRSENADRVKVTILDAASKAVFTEEIKTDQASFVHTILKIFRLVNTPSCWKTETAEQRSILRMQNLLLKFRRTLSKSVTAVKQL